MKTRLFFAVVALFGCGMTKATFAAEHTNIVVIMVDDMGFSDIGPYGSEIPTPHLDALAAGGVKFSQFYNTGRCCPTRASLLTGLYSHQAGIGYMTDDQGIPGYRGQLTSECVTIAEVLKSAGYFTAMTGKWHVGFNHGVTPWGRGFDRSLNTPAGGLHFSNQSGSKGNTELYLNGQLVSRDDAQFNPPWYGADLWTRQGIKFIDEAIAEQKPFFWYLAHAAPHFPCMAPESTIAKYRGKFMQGWDVLREERYARQLKSGLIDSSSKLAPRPDGLPAWDSISPEEQKRYDDMMAIYAAMIEEVDKNIGVLVNALRERGQLNNTLIMFLSDNGGNAESGVKGKYVGEHPGNEESDVFIGQCWAHLNNTPFRRYKHYNHEGGIASPLIAHWPSAVKLSVENEGWIRTPTHLIDIMATCVDLGGAVYPSERSGHAITEMQGQSLRPLLVGEGNFAERPLYWEHEGNAAIRVGDQKLVRAGERGEWELFNLGNDRTELVDLAHQHVDAAEQLRQQWETWATQVHAIPRPGNRKATDSAPKAKKKKKAAKKSN